MFLPAGLKHAASSILTGEYTVATLTESMKEAFDQEHHPDRWSQEREPWATDHAFRSATGSLYF